MRSPAEGAARITNVVAIGLISVVVATVVVLQLRSQQEVAETLRNEDPASLAFLIDDLHRANDELAAQGLALAAERDRLAGGGSGTADAALADERRRLRIIEGLDPVHGPGVVIQVDAPLTSLDLEDTVNNLRIAGAEAVTVNGRRVITGTAIDQEGATVRIDGHAVAGPWTVAAIGDPQRLADAADVMTRSLQADRRVRSAAYRSDPDVRIPATVGQRPFLYGST